MKTLAPLFLLLFAASCSQTPREASFQPTPVAESQLVTPKTDPATDQVTTEVRPSAIPQAPTQTPMDSPVLAQAAQPQPQPQPQPSAGVPPPVVQPQAQPQPPSQQSAQPPLTTPGTPPPGLAAAAPGAAPAAGTGAEPEMEEVVDVIDFRNMPLDQVLQYYADLVNRTLLRPANIAAQQQITLQSQTRLTKKEAIQALDTVLGMNGIAMVNFGDKFVKVVPTAEAPQAGAAPDTRGHDQLANMGPFITHVVQLKYIRPTEVQPVLQAFAKSPNAILPIDASQTVVLRDYTENVKRMLEMIELIDVALPSEILSEVIPIKYAKAAEIADALNSLAGGGGGANIGRTQPATANRTPGTLNTARPGMPTSQPNLGIAGGAAAGAAGSSFTSRLQRIVERAQASGELEILGKMKMIADERSNSLLIFASAPDMDMIKKIIDKLDVVTPQVLIETVIMDAQFGNTWSLGVSAGQPPKSGSNGTIGGVYNNPSSNPLGTLGQFFSSEGLTNGVFPNASGLSYFGRYRGELDVVLQAAATDSRINVLQKPRIITSHARMGRIFVGSTVPYVTGSTYGGAYGTGSTYQQLQVGIGLEVTPYINPDGLVVMEITEEISEISGAIDIQNVGAVPTTTSRQIAADVAVRDGDTILLGGFIRNSSNKQNSGVPLLKDIPLLGALFSSRSDAKERKELLVMMRPTVLKTPEIAALATMQEKERLPGVLEAEKEVLELERKELERSRRNTPAPAKAPVFDETPFNTAK